MSRVLIILLMCGVTLASPVPKDASPRTLPANTNAVLKAANGKATYDASTQFQGWEIGKLFDGDEKTAWYSAGNDVPKNGAKPWVRVTFPETVTVSRVTILGNREPNFPTGYFVLAGTLELLNAKGDVIAKEDLVSKGAKHDFDLELAKPAENVKAIRFTMTKDEGPQNSNCVGLSEMQVE